MTELESLITTALDKTNAIYVKRTREEIRKLADADLKKYRITTESTKDECMDVMIKHHLTREGYDRMYEIMHKKTAIPLQRITSSPINDFIIEYELIEQNWEQVILRKLRNNEYVELISVQLMGKKVSVSVDDRGERKIWDEFPPHTSYDARTLVKRIFELAGVTADP